MPQNACVVIQQLNKDIPPETAQPLAILEHDSGAVGSLIRRLERPHLHVCNGSDQAYRNTSGKAGLRLVTARFLDDWFSFRLRNDPGDAVPSGRDVPRWTHHSRMLRADRRIWPP